MSASDSIRFLLGGASILAFTAAAPALAAEPAVHRVHANYVLGTSFDMAVNASSEAEAAFAFAAVQAEIARLDRVLSGWRDDSELAALNRTGQATASPDLYAVLASAETWNSRTGGAFNARMGSGPNEASRQPLVLDAPTRSVTLPAGATIAADGIAKGYILDCALDAARRAAPCAAGILINIGGDIATFGVSEGGRPWAVGVAHPDAQADNARPAQVLSLCGKALAVSGPGPRDRVVDGFAVSHLTDPATGKPAPRRQAAVVAARAADADAAATALAVLESVRAIALAERLPGIEALIFDTDGSTSATSGWGMNLRNDMLCQAAIPANMKIEISYELPRIAARNYKNPFVIIWVTDAEKNTVKTLMVSINKPNWIDSNYVWWRRIGRSNPGQIEANAKPTKAPGVYTIEWDGTNTAGLRMPQGDYIIHIEAAREHGGHAYQAIPVKLGTAPASASQPGENELGTGRVRYSRR